MISNRYDGKCTSCGEYVEVGEGFVFRGNGRWLTVCASSACHRKTVGVDEPAKPVKKTAPERRLTEDGRVIMGYDAAALPLLRSMPGARWNPEAKHWQVSVKPGDLSRVIDISEQIGLDIPQSLKDAEQAGTVESREAMQRADRKRVDGKTLYPYQREGVNFLALHDRALLADDMGLGKSVEALVALPENERVMIICPASVKCNWRDEINMWRPDYAVKIIKGKKNFELPEYGEIVILNYDILPKWLTPTKESGIFTRKGDPILEADLTPEQVRILGETTVIDDESHLVKNYKSARSKKVNQLSRKSKRVWFLTGTPLLTRPTDMWGMLQSGNMSPFGSWYKFVELFDGSMNRFGGYEFGMPRPELAERLRRVMLRRLKKDVLPDLPPKTYQRIEVNDIGKDAKKSADALSKSIAAHEGVKAKGDFVGDLDMSNLPDFDEFSRVRAQLAKSRIPAMLEIVDGYEETETPLLVFSAHRAPIDALADRDGWRVITGDVSSEERSEIVREFQAGNLKGVALTIKAGGVGITLTHASHVLFVDLDWTPALNIQAEDRVCRIGQTSEKVLIQRMVSSHPLDIHVQNLIEHKIELAYLALEASVSYEQKSSGKNGTGHKQVAKVIEETDEELAERIRNATASATHQIAMDKINKVSDRESAKVAEVPLPELTQARKDMLRDALAYMTSVCDGALTKDGMGFSKPDVGMSQWVLDTGLEDDNEEAFRFLERILVRYRRQLSGSFSQIWS